MKTALHFFRGWGLSAALMLTAMPLARGADALTTPVVRVDVLMVSMPEEKFLTLQPDLLDPSKIEKAVPDILDAVKRKEMILDGYQFITVKSGERAVAETVKEVRYPSGMTFRQATAAELNAITQAIKAGNLAIIDPTTPTPMDTRNSGVSFEVETTVSSDAKYVHLDVAPQSVELVGFQDPHDAGKVGFAAKADSKTPTDRPVFYTMKDLTSIELRDGQHMLLGVHKAFKPEGYMEVFIIHAAILRAGK